MKLTKESTSRPEYHYLALGDSYTIGEQVPVAGNFPNQVQALLQQHNINMDPPRIIAKTGWTTDELEVGIREAGENEPFRKSYELVSLLIGVNNQYRGRSAENYRLEFEGLLNKAIGFAGSKKENVVVLSIPDWGITPFAEGSDRKAIADGIDRFNKINESVSKEHDIHYINITPWTREAIADPSLLAPDKLHPSAAEYARWAAEISAWFRAKMS